MVSCLLAGLSLLLNGGVYRFPFTVPFFLLLWRFISSTTHTQNAEVQAACGGRARLHFATQLHFARGLVEEINRNVKNNEERKHQDFLKWLEKIP